MLPVRPSALDPDFAPEIPPTNSANTAHSPAESSIHVQQICPNCGETLSGHHCKLICTGCGYYLSCSDFY